MVEGGTCQEDDLAEGVVGQLTHYRRWGRCQRIPATLGSYRPFDVAALGSKSVADIRLLTSHQAFNGKGPTER